MSDWTVLFEGTNFARLLYGLWITIRIAGISLAFSMILGVFVGVAMTSKNRVIRFLMRIYLEFIRIMPQLVLLFLVYFGLARGTGVETTRMVTGAAVSLASTA